MVRTLCILLAPACAVPAVAQRRTARRPRTEAVRTAPALPPHAEPFEFALPEPPADRRTVADLSAGLRDPRTRGACLAGLVRLDLAALRPQASPPQAAGLPADLLRAFLASPNADEADAAAFLYGLTGAADGPQVLSGAVLDRAKRGDDATGCVLGLLLCGGEPALAWLGKLCARPRCPAAFTLSALRAADVAVREPAIGLNRRHLHAFAAGLLTSCEAAEPAADRLTRWRAWDQTPTVLAAAYPATDADADRARCNTLAVTRFALACAADPAAGESGRLCRSWLAETNAADPDLIRRAKRIAGR